MHQHRINGRKLQKRIHIADAALFDELIETIDLGGQVGVALCKGCKITCAQYRIEIVSRQKCRKLHEILLRHIGCGGR